ASTRSPSGPMTCARRREPPRAATSASSVPSPPSASGTSTTSSNPAVCKPREIAAVAAAASSVPRNLSGQATDRAGMADRLPLTPPPARTRHMLERVPLLEKELADYEEVAGAEAIERIRALAEPFRGARVLHINATAYGGGVAELLSTHVPLLRSLGI